MSKLVAHDWEWDSTGNRPRRKRVAEIVVIQLARQLQINARSLHRYEDACFHREKLGDHSEMGGQESRPRCSEIRESGNLVGLLRPCRHRALHWYGWRVFLHFLRPFLAHLRLLVAIGFE